MATGYKIEIRAVPATRHRKAAYEVTPYGMYDENAYVIFDLANARQYARTLGKRLGLWVHDYTNMKNDKPAHY